MDVLVVGGGGRESALCWALKRSKDVGRVYCAPGNGGIEESVPIGVMDFPALVDFARSHQIGFVVVGPDNPLASGLVDVMEDAGFPCFGPDRKAARIEASKAFAKDLMWKYHIPTASYEIFTDLPKALAYVQKAPLPLVIKADGLALGKGVVIAQSREGAEQAVRRAMEDGAFGESGKTLVIEEFLTGPEVSVLSFTDGKTIVPMVSSMDHKRVGDGDVGPNTGGMGAVAPNPWYTPQVADQAMRTIFLPTVEAMRSEGCPFKGCLYFGLMLTPDGPKVIEYNCRFGDPEAQVVLPLLESDLLSVMEKVRSGSLKSKDVRFSTQAACSVVLCSGGYPGSYQVGREITIGETDGALLFHAGTKKVGGKLLTSGGRVMDVTATAPTLREAITAAYRAAEKVSFEGRYLRQDIGRRALLGE
ncbi:MAG: phosphoribosylamine--glycine ligase [Sphaerochaeta sp.]|nr:phosphoribosylamine--glycine ligase [Sphaerochaeta sp.]